MSPTGDLLVTLIFLGEVSSWEKIRERIREKGKGKGKGKAKGKR